MGVQMMSESPGRAVSCLDFTTGSGIPEPQIASVWEGIEVNIATCLACSIPASGHFLLSTVRDEMLGQAGSWPARLATLVNVLPVPQPFPSVSIQLVSAEGSHSDAGSVCADNQTELPPSMERTGGIGDSRPPSFQ